MSMLSGQSDPSAGGLLAHRRGGRVPPREIWRAFVRMLGLVRPHRRAMALGLFLSLGVAVAYVASLAGVIPVLKVIVENEDLHSSLKSQAEWAAGQTDGGVKGWALRAVAPLISAAAGLIPASDGSVDATRNAKRKALLVVVLALVIINLVGNTLRVLSQYLIIYASHRMVMDLRRHMYRKALRVPVNAIAGNVSNTVSQFMTDIREVFLGIVTLFGKVAREPLKAVCVFALALMLDARLTLILLAVAPPAVGLLWYFGRKVRKATVRLLQGYGRMLGSLEETLQGILVVKGYAREGEERRRMWGLERRMFKQQLRLAWIESLSSPLIEVIGVTLAAAGIVWLGSQAIAGEISPTHFIAMVMLLAAMLDPIRKVANVYNNVQRSAAAAHRIFGFLDWPEETSPADAKRLPNQPHEVCFDAVNFRYVPNAPLALCDVSLTVAPGECVAIVGPNGSGKSTLLKLLARFIEPDSGRVLIDGIDATELSLKALREQIAIVSQQPMIFARSAAENIGYGKPAPRSDAARKTRREEVREAARRAFAAEFIEALPEEYDTVLGEFGATLSGGERQRISIARAFLKPASIVIFDEATSEVDAESERKIHAALKQLRQGKTTFLIAHRHTVMDMAERIVVMDAGRIVDTGTHAELIERCPLYQGLYRAEPVH